MTEDKTGAVMKCLKCGREIVVETAHIGPNRLAVTTVICFECLSPEDKERIVSSYPLFGGKEG